MRSGGGDACHAPWRLTDASLNSQVSHKGGGINTGIHPVNMATTNTLRGPRMITMITVLVFALGVTSVRGEMLDLTHNLNEQSMHYQQFRDFQLENAVKRHIPELNGLWVEANNILMSEHTGTHMDAPVHTWKTGIKMHQIHTEDLVGPVVVISVVNQTKTDPMYKVQVKDLQDFEEKYGQIPNRGIVLMNSDGAKQYWNHSAYLGTATPEVGDGNMTFPGFGGPSVEWLIANRNIRGIGVDRMSLDAGHNIEAHIALLSHDRWGIENMNNVHKLPKAGATLVVGGLPIEGGSGSPARVIAFWGTDMPPFTSSTSGLYPRMCEMVVGVVLMVMMMWPF